MSVVALGNKTYLGLPDTVDLVPGHCLIVPTGHFGTSLECDDDIWDEIRVCYTRLTMEFHEVPDSDVC